MKCFNMLFDCSRMNESYGRFLCSQKIHRVRQHRFRCRTSYSDPYRIGCPCDTEWCQFCMAKQHRYCAAAAQEMRYCAFNRAEPLQRRICKALARHIKYLTNGRFIHRGLTLKSIFYMYNLILVYGFALDLDE